MHEFRKAASVDPVLGTAFVRVAQMIDPPESLMTPAMEMRVLRSASKAVPAGGQGLPDEGQLEGAAHANE
jgi:hypothetical protein